VRIYKLLRTIKNPFDKKRAYFPPPFAGFVGTGVFSVPPPSAGLVSFTGVGVVFVAGFTSFAGVGVLFGAGVGVTAGFTSFAGVGVLFGAGVGVTAGFTSFAGVGVLLGAGAGVATGFTSFAGVGLLLGAGAGVGVLFGAVPPPPLFGVFTGFGWLFCGLFVGFSMPPLLLFVFGLLVGGATFAV
jgi:hypothetical protein